MSQVQKLQEEDVVRWFKIPGNFLFRYDIQGKPVAFLLSVLAVSTFLTVFFYFFDGGFSTAFALALGAACWSAYKVITSFYTVSRTMVGISKSELMLVRNNQGFLIPLSSITSNGFTDAEKVRRSIDYIAIEADGKRFKIKTMSLYFQMKNMHSFLGMLLDSTEPDA